MTPLNLNSLPHALVAAEEGSFNRAASVLGLRQSAVSRRIKALEDELGASLFERSKNHNRLTYAGQNFLEAVQRAFDNIEAAAQCVRSAGQGIVGDICLGIEAPLSDPFLIDLIHDYRASHPQVSIRIIQGSKTESMRRLTRREIDFALVHCRPIGADPDLMNQNLDIHHLWATRLFVAMPKEHRFSKKKIVDLHTLHSEQIMVGDYGCDATINDYYATLRCCASEPTRIDRQMVNREALINLVSLGFGVTFTGAPDNFKHKKNIVVRPIQGAVERLTYTGAWLPHNDNPALRRFISLAKTKAQAELNIAGNPSPA